jgi:SAM-dependent methyltransferase
MLEGELASGRRFVPEYLLPSLKRLGLGNAKLLSVGCGFGEDVAELRRHRYEAYGVELWGLRASKWAELERSPDWHYIADARKLPFADNAFDVILCIGLIEHIGTVGDSSELHPDWRHQRRTFLKEMLRVAKYGVLLQTPNRTFRISGTAQHATGYFFGLDAGRAYGCIRPFSAFMSLIMTLRSMWATCQQP